MLYQDEFGAFCISNWDERQYTNNPTERTRKYRKEVDERNADETVLKRNGNAVETNSSVSTSVSLINNKVLKEYESEIGVLTKMISEELLDAENEYSADWVVSALQEAARNNKRNWKYALAILKRWKSEGFQSNHKNVKREEVPTEVWG